MGIYDIYEKKKKYTQKDSKLYAHVGKSFEAEEKRNSVHLCKKKITMEEDWNRWKLMLRKKEGSSSNSRVGKVYPELLVRKSFCSVIKAVIYGEQRQLIEYLYELLIALSDQYSRKINHTFYRIVVLL